jgi:diaminopimelate epimerase
MTPFFKLSGSGNDFVGLAEPEREPTAPQIRAWCRRGISLGADGVLALRREPGAGVVMDYWNADGLPADLCLNGTRCAAQLAFQLGWAGERVEIATPAGRIAARRLDGTRVALELPAPSEAPRELTLPACGRQWTGWALTVGVPHFVLPWPEDLAAAPVAAAGPVLRRDAAFPEGANVNWVRFSDAGPESGPGSGRDFGHMEIRTYERGVEAETLSCGSGILAGVAVGVALGRLRLPVTVLTWGGFELEVGEAGKAEGTTGTPLAAPARWTLAGDARVVARGELLPEAETEPGEER